MEQSNTLWPTALRADGNYFNFWTIIYWVKFFRLCVSEEWTGDVHMRRDLVLAVGEDDDAEETSKDEKRKRLKRQKEHRKEKERQQEKRAENFAKKWRDEAREVQSRFFFQPLF